MTDAENKPPRTATDMSPEAIAARIRRVVELNRLCKSLGAAVPSEPSSADDRLAPDVSPRR